MPAMASYGRMRCDYKTRKRNVRAGGVTFRIQEEGPGEALLLIHGGPGVDHRSLHPGMSCFAPYRRLIYVDLRGHGASSEAKRYGLTVDADDVEALRRALGFGPLDVPGRAYGGAVALKWAARHPRGARRAIA
jgi:proline iminopeptidase